MLLVFELAQRMREHDLSDGNIGEGNWKRYIKDIVEQSPCIELPDVTS